MKKASNPGSVWTNENSPSKVVTLEKPSFPGIPKNPSSSNASRQTTGMNSCLPAKRKTRSLPSKLNSSSSGSLKAPNGASIGRLFLQFGRSFLKQRKRIGQKIPSTTSFWRNSKRKVWNHPRKPIHGLFSEGARSTSSDSLLPWINSRRLKRSPTSNFSTTRTSARSGPANGSMSPVMPIHRDTKKTSRVKCTFTAIGSSRLSTMTWATMTSSSIKSPVTFFRTPPRTTKLRLAICATP